MEADYCSEDAYLSEVDFSREEEPPCGTELHNILTVEDNKDKFFSYLKANNYPPGILPLDMTNLVLSSGAVKCTKALIEQENGYTFDVNGSLSSHSQWTPLHVASLVANLELCRLLVHHGAQLNARTSTTKRFSFYTFELLYNKLPLDCVLHLFKQINDILSRPWNPHEHIFRVIVLLCLPNQRQRLKVLRWLVERTEEVEKEISRYITEGKVIEVAALLLAAHEKVMSPSVFKYLCPTGLEGSLTFDNFISKDIVTLENLKLAITGRGNCNLARKFQRQLALMMPVFQLLGIFARVGDRVLTFLKEEQWNVSDQTVAKIVASIFLDAGFPVKEQDYNLTIWDSLESGHLLLGFLFPKPSLEDFGNTRTPAIKPAKQETTPKLGEVTPSPGKLKRGSQNIVVPAFNQSLVSLAVHDQSSNYGRPQSLPIELEKLGKHEYLNDWSPRKSIFKLIYISCLPKLQGLLESIRSLAVESEEIGEFSCLCLKEGKLVELAVLLMVARERLLGKTTRNRVASLSDNSSELRQCLMHEMSSAINEELMSVATFQSSKLVRTCKNKKQMMFRANLLLEVFERAGHCIDQYLQSDLYRRRTTNVQVADDVAWLLKHRDFVMRQQDTNLSDMKCFPTIVELTPKEAEMLNELRERFSTTDGIQLCSPVHLFSPAEKKHGSSMVSGQQRSFGSAAHSFHTRRVLDSSFDFMTCKPKGTQTMKIVRPMVNFLSGKQFTISALAFKRGTKLYDLPSFGPSTRLHPSFLLN